MGPKKDMGPKDMGPKKDAGPKDQGPPKMGELAHLHVAELSPGMTLMISQQS